ncbi:hypothetical protein AGMMS49525_08250 [Bacteroidia bacterium]|nr:hypothetical protein AGMMS49525_08250 [Bacteroidia bacterium]
MKKTIALTIASLLLTVSSFAATGSWTSGSTTVVLTADSTLTISGTGAMDNYTFANRAPWVVSHRLSIKTVVINNGVTSIGEYAFFGCYELSSVTIPNSVTSIEDYAFRGCIGLTSAPIPSSVTSIGKSAFTHCIGLTTVSIPSSVKSIEEYTFYACLGLTSVTIPSSVTSIGENAFSECSGLTSVTIPSSVVNIGSSAFSYCRGLTAINVDIANTKYSSIEGVLYNQNHTVLIQYPVGTQGAFAVPSSVDSIGDYAFAWCIGLTSVTIPSSVTSIGNQTFELCRGLTSVTIPNSVTSIGWGAFADCSGLTSVTCLATTPLPLYGYNFDTVSTDTLYVPATSLDAYKNDSDWNSAFGTILALAPGTSIEPAAATQLFIYPNLVKETVTIKNASGKTVSIFNTLGKKVFENRVQSDMETIGVANWQKGIYIVRISDAGKVVGTAKLIKD